MERHLWQVHVQVRGREGGGLGVGDSGVAGEQLAGDGVADGVAEVEPWVWSGSELEPEVEGGVENVLSMGWSAVDLRRDGRWDLVVATIVMV